MRKGISTIDIIVLYCAGISKESYKLSIDSSLFYKFLLYTIHIKLENSRDIPDNRKSRGYHTCENR